MDLVDALIQQKIDETYQNPYLRFSNAASQAIQPGAFSGEDDWLAAALSGAAIGLTNRLGRERAQEDRLDLLTNLNSASSEAQAAAMTGVDFDPAKFGDYADIAKALHQDAATKQQLERLKIEQGLGERERQKQLDLKYQLLGKGQSYDPTSGFSVDPTYLSAIGSEAATRGSATARGRLGAELDLGPQVEQAKVLARGGAERLNDLRGREFNAALAAGGNPDVAKDFTEIIRRVPQKFQTQAVDELDTKARVEKSLSRVDEIMNKGFETATLGSNLNPFGEDARIRKAIQAELTGIVQEVNKGPMSDTDAARILEPVLPSLHDNAQSLQQKKEALRSIIIRSAKETPLLNQLGMAEEPQISSPSGLSPAEEAELMQLRQRFGK